MQQKIGWLLTMCLGTLGLVPCGCASDPTRPPPAGRVDLLRLDEYPQIVATENLHRWLVFSPPSVATATEEQPMHVSVPLRSVYDKTSLYVQYRFIWLDASHRPLRTNPGYLFLKLQPRVQQFIEGNALAPSAVRWRLEIRAAR